MKSHIAIISKNKERVLPSDFKLDLTLKNPLFNDIEMMSFPVRLPLDGNRDFVKNAEDVNSAFRAIDIEHTKATIIVDGLPFADGVIKIQDDEEIKDSISFNIDSEQLSFKELIGDLQCHDIPVDDDILIGEKIGNVHAKVEYSTKVTVKFSGKKSDENIGTTENAFLETTCEPQALGFSYPAKCEDNNEKHVAPTYKKLVYANNNNVRIPVVDESYINIDKPYAEWDNINNKWVTVSKYCNARVAYKHYGLNSDGTTSDGVDKRVESEYSTEPENHGIVWCLDANRPQSGICFYVLYFLDCLFKYLGVSFDRDELMAVEDLRRLCFFTTKCKYTTKPLYGHTTEGDGYWVTEIYDKARTSDKLDKLFKIANEWLSSRGCGGQLSLDKPKDKSVQKLRYQTQECFAVIDPETGHRHLVWEDGEWTDAEVGKNNVTSIIIKSTVEKAEVNYDIQRMYATSENFPTASVSDVISSLEINLVFVLYIIAKPKM